MPNERTRTCAHVDHSGRCWRTPVALGRCAQHVALHPDEIGILRALDDRTTLVRREMEALGADILLRTVVAQGKVDESVLKNYRALWHQHNYLTVLKKDRRPGEPLPAEALL